MKNLLFDQTVLGVTATRLGLGNTPKLPVARLGSAALDMGVYKGLVGYIPLGVDVLRENYIQGSPTLSPHAVVSLYARLPVHHQRGGSSRLMRYRIPHIGCPWLPCRPPRVRQPAGVAPGGSLSPTRIVELKRQDLYPPAFSAALAHLVRAY